MSQPSDWSAQYAQVVGGEVRRWRETRKMSTQQLADAVGELGVDLKRPVLSNLENQRRNTVSVAEVLALAVALRVPPALLMFPVGRIDDLEVLPGVHTDPWSALRWFNGDGELPGVGTPRDSHARVLARYEQHDEMVDQWRTARAAGRLGDRDWSATAGRIRGWLTSVRADLELGGFVLPPLPDELRLALEGTTTPEPPPELRADP